MDDLQTASEVAGSERLSRFLLNKRDFDLGARAVKPHAFVAWCSKDRARFEDSVFRTQTLSETEIWNAGDDVAQQRGRDLLGRADILASQVYGLGLTVQADEPPPNHACIVGWPEGDDIDAITARKSLAQQLAAASKLVVVLRAA